MSNIPRSYPNVSVLTFLSNTSALIGFSWLLFPLPLLLLSLLMPLPLLVLLVVLQRLPSLSVLPAFKVVLVPTWVDPLQQSRFVESFPTLTLIYPS